MWKQLYNSSDKKNIYTVIIVLLSLLILLFVTKDFYDSNLEKNASLETLNKQSEDLKTELDSLNKIKIELSSSVKMQKIMNQYGWDFREDQIINNIFNNNKWINIASISMDKGEKLPNWLTLANVSLSVQSSSMADLNNYYSYLTSEDSKMRFIIKNTNFPYDIKNNSSIPVSLSLWMYYFSK